MEPREKQPQFNTSILSYAKTHRKSMKNADYRKLNDRSSNSSKYHKKDGTPVRAKLKVALVKEVRQG